MLRVVGGAAAPWAENAPPGHRCLLVTLESAPAPIRLHSTCSARVRFRARPKRATSTSASNLHSAEFHAAVAATSPASPSSGFERNLKTVIRHISQSVCPWNVKFSQELAEDSPFAPREFIAGKDALTLARDILALDQEQFSAAFRKSPMKPAKLAGLRRNATEALDNAGTSDYTRAPTCPCQELPP